MRFKKKHSKFECSVRQRYVCAWDHLHEAVRLWSHANLLCFWCDAVRRLKHSTFSSFHRFVEHLEIVLFRCVFQFASFRSHLSFAQCDRIPDQCFERFEKKSRCTIDAIVACTFDRRFFFFQIGIEWFAISSMFPWASMCARPYNFPNVDCTHGKRSIAICLKIDFHSMHNSYDSMTLWPSRFVRYFLFSKSCSSSILAPDRVIYYLIGCTKEQSNSQQQRMVKYPACFFFSFVHSLALPWF